MNNKSTENLIESGGSIEELFVAPEILNDTEKVNKDRDVPQNSFLAEKSDIELQPRPSVSKIPVPAARKLSLPPIPSKRNGKELKENRNQLTQRMSLQSDDPIQIINERKHRKKRISDVKKRVSDSETDSYIEEKPSFRKQRKNTFELTTRSRENPKNVKKLFVSSEGNEETTSFISYEEKHEKEDNSEHTPSNHTFVNSNSSNDDAAGATNEAFVPDDIVQDKNKEDDKVKPTHQNADEMTQVTEKSHKNKFKKKKEKIKSTKKPKEKRKKHVPEQSREQIESIEEAAIPEVYDFKKVIGKQCLMSFRFQ